MNVHAQSGSSSDYFQDDDPAFLDALNNIVLPGDKPEDIENDGVKTGDGNTDDSDVIEEFEPPFLKRKRTPTPELSPTSVQERAIKYKVHKAPPKVYNDSNDIYGASHFGEFGEYMQRKRAKLQIQNEEIVEESQHLGDAQPKIFQGLSIYINGWTQPSIQELRRMIVQHGGVFQPYLDKKSIVTHIITCSITPAKLREWKHRKVVGPEWLVESVRAGILLNWRDFIFIPTERDEPTQGASGRQKRLVPVGSLKPPGLPPMQQQVQAKDTIAPKRDPVQTVGSSTTPSNAPHPNQPPPSQIPRPPNVIAGAPPNKAPDQPTGPPPPQPKLQPPTTHSTDPIHPNVPYAELESNPNAQRAMANPEWRKAHTSVAPDFIEGYYKSSRLHHLATWKAELKHLVTEAQERAEADGQGSNGKENMITAGGGGVSMRGAELVMKSSNSGAGINAKGKGKAIEEYPKERVILHCDFDCFFVSAGLVSRPHLKGKPVVVCHSQGTTGGKSSTSEIASASYEARDFGIKNGMSLQQARKLCPDIQTIPYEFEKYKEFSLKFYTILMRHADDLQAVSVDEALLDVSNAVLQHKVNNPAKSKDGPMWDPAKELAESIRDDIRAATECEVSIGISHNILLARLATRLAKPAKSYHLLPNEVSSFLAPLNITDLHGFGWAIKQKAEEKLGTSVLGELGKKSKGILCDALGKVNGERLYNAIRGVDDKKLESDKKRKSVSCEINYGIRFENNEQAEAFVSQMAAEVMKRMKDVDVVGRSITLKIMKRDPSAPVEPPKFLGHGPCETFSKQSPLIGPNGRTTNEGKIIGEHAWRLLKSFNFDPKELRGIGIQVQKLEPVSGSNNAASSGGIHHDNEGQAVLPFRRVEVPTGKSLLGKNGVASSDIQGGAIGKAKHASASISKSPTIAVQPPSEDDDIVLLSQAPAAFQHKAARGAVSTSARGSVAAGPSNVPVNPSVAHLDLPSYSQLDKSVLEALPPDIRQEIEQEYKRRSASPMPVVVNNNNIGHDNTRRSKSPSKIIAPRIANPQRPKKSAPLMARGGRLVARGFVRQHARPLFPTNKKKLVNIPRITGQLAPRNRPGNHTTAHKSNLFGAPKQHSFTTPSSNSRWAKALLNLASVVNPQTRKPTVVISPEKLKEYKIDPAVFFALPEHIQREQLVRMRLLKKNGGVLPSPENSQRLVLKATRPAWPPGWKPYIAPPPYANFKPVPVIRRVVDGIKRAYSETGDIQDLIEAWVNNCRKWNKLPKEGDLEFLTKWIVRAVDKEQATDVDVIRAVAVMKWWRVLLRRNWGAAEIFDDELDGSQIDQVGRAWWIAFEGVKDKMDEVARKKWGGCLSLR